MDDRFDMFTINWIGVVDGLVDHELDSIRILAKVSVFIVVKLDRIAVIT